LSSLSTSCWPRSSEENACCVLESWEVIIKLSVSPFRLSCITAPRNFLYLLMVFQSPDRIVRALVCSWVFVSSLFQCWTWFLIYWGAVSCFVYFCFIRLAYFADSIWFSRRHIFAVIWYDYLYRAYCTSWNQKYQQYSGFSPTNSPPPFRLSM
jgi:hypothetical protein